MGGHVPLAPGATVHGHPSLVFFLVLLFLRTCLTKISELLLLSMVLQSHQDFKNRSSLLPAMVLGPGDRAEAGVWSQQVLDDSVVSTGPVSVASQARLFPHLPFYPSWSWPVSPPAQHHVPPSLIHPTGRAGPLVSADAQGLSISLVSRGLEGADSQEEGASQSWTLANFRTDSHHLSVTGKGEAKLNSTSFVLKWLGVLKGDGEQGGT